MLNFETYETFLGHSPLDQRHLFVAASRGAEIQKIRKDLRKAKRASRFATRPASSPGTIAKPATLTR